MDGSKSSSLPRVKGWVPPLAVCVIGVMLVYWAWGRSGELLLDFGRELYISWQVSQGKHLYHQLDYRFGPLAVCANGLWMWMFGPGIETVLVANLIVLIVTCVLLYVLLIKMADWLTASIGIIVFLCMFGVGTGTPLAQYNFLTPYNHGATYGLMLTFAALVLVERYCRTGKASAAAVAGFFTGLCFLTKPEMFLACATAVACGLVAGALGSRQCLRRLIVAALVGIIVAPIIAFLALARIIPAETALAGTMGGWQFVSNKGLVQSPFYRSCLGTDHLGQNIILMLMSAAGYAAFIAIGVFVAGRPRIRIANLLGASLGCAIGALLLMRGPIQGNIERGLPVAMAVAMMTWGWRLWISRRKGAASADVLRFSFAILSTVLLFKILFFARTWHYGFVLAAPALTTAIVILLYAVPRRLEGQGRSPWALRLAVIGLLTGLVARRLVTTDVYYRGHDATASLKLGGTINLAPPDVAAAPVIDQLTDLIPPGGTLGVFPDSAGLNYATGRPASIAFTVFNPFELQMSGEATIMQALKKSPPDCIAIVTTDESDYGAKTFGADFGVTIWKWIEQSYALRSITPGPNDGVQSVRRIYVYTLRRGTGPRGTRGTGILPVSDGTPSRLAGTPAKEDRAQRPMSQ